LETVQMTMIPKIGLNKSTLALGALILEKFVREGRSPTAGIQEVVNDVTGIATGNIDPRTWSESTIAVAIAGASLAMGSSINTNTAIGLAAGSPEFALGAMAGPGGRLVGGKSATRGGRRFVSNYRSSRRQGVPRRQSFRFARRRRR